MRDGLVIAKRCPQCGRLLSRDSLRCGYCLAEVWDVAADTEVAAAPALDAAGPAPLTRLRSGLSRLFALPKWLLLLVVVALVFGGWYLFRSLQPERTLALPAVATRSISASASLWPAADGDALHTRHTDVAVDLAAATEAWQTDMGVSSVGAPVADNSRLYVTTTDNRIIALSLDDGSAVWTFEDRVPIGDAPIVAGDRLYVFNRAGDAICLDAATGRELWRTPLPSHFYNSPTLVDGVLYAFGTTNALYGLDSEDGHLLWTVGTGSDWATLPPVVSGNWIILATNGTVNVYNRKSGKLTLQHPQTGVVGLALDQGRIVSVSPNFIAQVDPTATLPWWWGARGAWFQTWVWGLAPEPPRFGLEWLSSLRPAGLKPLESTPVVFPAAIADGAAVVANVSGQVRAFSTASGDQLWSIEVGDVTGAPLWTASGILLPLRDALSLRSPSDGSEIARQPLPVALRRAVVVTAQGVFLAASDGRIVALH